MKYLLMIFSLFLNTCSLAQENESYPSEQIQQVEELTEDDSETEDDAYVQQLEYYKKHRLNINEADAAELAELQMLTDLQVRNFFLYRNLMGSFVSLYELQSIPAWDVLTIKKLLSYITISDTKKWSERITDRLLNGERSLMLKFSMIHPKSKGFIKNDSSARGYAGSRPALLTRYRYRYKNLLQYGLLGDKDAGEQFLKGAQRRGFDFYSYHFFIRKLGSIKSLAIGDFTLNMGQGLIHWQSMAFKKSSAAVSVKKQSEVIRPYNSAGEYNFHRGVAISLAKKKWETTMFASVRKLSAIMKTEPFQGDRKYTSSVLTSGYHRNLSEINSRNNLQAIAFGGNIQYTNPRGWHQGINFVNYHFSTPFRPSGKPSDYFAIAGNNWNNFSFDYSYTYRNIHLFGEIAADKNLNPAILNGIVASVDGSVDLSLLHRRIDKGYQSIHGNAFTENSSPTNESGIYFGVSIRPWHHWKIDAYADLYRFPWLKFSLDAPGYGAEYLTQVTFTPNKQVEVYIKYKKEAKHSSETVNGPTTQLIDVPRRSLRTNVSYKLNRGVLIRHRSEVLWYSDEPGKTERGYLINADLIYKPYAKLFSGNSRLQYFETDGYSSRLYAYEHDVLYHHSSPPFFGKGFRLYLNVRTDVSKWLFHRSSKLHTEFWMKYAITSYLEGKKIGSGLDEIQGKHRSEFKFQLLFFQ